MKKRLTKKQIKLLNKALSIINKCIIYYKNPSNTVIGMCTALGDCKGSFKIKEAFNTTKPNNDCYGQENLWWYPLGDKYSRIDHLERIKKDILLYL